jgi:molecular chaperone GrpE
MQAGYELQGRLIRPAMVVVTPKAPAQPAAPSPDQAAYARANGGDAGASVDQKA